MPIMLVLYIRTVIQQCNSPSFKSKAIVQTLRQIEYRYKVFKCTLKSTTLTVSMRAGPTIREFSFSTFNILVMSCIKVHKRKVEKPEPRTRCYTIVLFLLVRGHRGALSSTTFNPRCQGRREAISQSTVRYSDQG